MPYFTKKPVRVEARRFTDAASAEDIRAWAEGGKRAVRIEENSLYIQTLEGEMRADLGDWIVMGVQGEIYPCKPDIFEETYQPA